MAGNSEKLQYSSLFSSSQPLIEEIDDRKRLIEKRQKKKNLFTGQYSKSSDNVHSPRKTDSLTHEDAFESSENVQQFREREAGRLHLGHNKLKQLLPSHNGSIWGSAAAAADIDRVMRFRGENIDTTEENIDKNTDSKQLNEQILNQSEDQQQQQLQQQQYNQQQSTLNPIIGPSNITVPFKLPRIDWLLNRRKLFGQSEPEDEFYCSGRHITKPAQQVVVDLQNQNQGYNNTTHQSYLDSQKKARFRLVQNIDNFDIDNYKKQQQQQQQTISQSFTSPNYCANSNSYSNANYISSPFSSNRPDNMNDINQQIPNAERMIQYQTEKVKQQQKQQQIKIELPVILSAAPTIHTGRSEYRNRVQKPLKWESSNQESIARFQSSLHEPLYSYMYNKQIKQKNTFLTKTNTASTLIAESQGQNQLVREQQNQNKDNQLTPSIMHGLAFKHKVLSDVERSKQYQGYAPDMQLEDIPAHLQKLTNALNIDHQISENQNSQIEINDQNANNIESQLGDVVNSDVQQDAQRNNAINASLQSQEGGTLKNAANFFSNAAEILDDISLQNISIPT
ncbi:MAG: hypothetical protein EZS28_000881 [Streblomastix strix]|uniref:Uncharacterized protein n=1 Tax=Streblomastix strix TaxID=222440 RepID=A0A5J4XAR7_9EUKA|nr:MAG: hypothetical protein EZS28_000881 [Streblomastix strix]